MDVQKAYSRAEAEWEEFSLEEKVSRFSEDLVTVLLEAIDRNEKAPELIDRNPLGHFRNVTPNDERKFWLELKRWIESGPCAKAWIQERAGDLELEDDDTDEDADYEAQQERNWR